MRAAAQLVELPETVLGGRSSGWAYCGAARHRESLAALGAIHHLAGKVRSISECFPAVGALHQIKVTGGRQESYLPKIDAPDSTRIDDWGRQWLRGRCAARCVSGPGNAMGLPWLAWSPESHEEHHRDGDKHQHSQKADTDSKHEEQSQHGRQCNRKYGNRLASGLLEREDDNGSAKNLRGLLRVQSTEYGRFHCGKFFCR
jgi:hypothetical protein